MALNANELERQIITAFRTQGRLLYPNVLKNVQVTEVPKEDGTFDYEVTEERGPLEIDAQQMTLFARAIAQAVVGHIKANAEVEDTTAAAIWRVK